MSILAQINIFFVPSHWRGSRLFISNDLATRLDSAGCECVLQHLTREELFTNLVFVGDSWASPHHVDYAMIAIVKNMASSQLSFSTLLELVVMHFLVHMTVIRTPSHRLENCYQLLNNHIDLRSALLISILGRIKRP